MVESEALAGVDLGIDRKTVATRVATLSKVPGFERVYRAMMMKIASETSCLDVFKSLGLMDELARGDLSILNGEKVEFGANIPTLGEYDPKTDTNKVSVNNISRESIIISMATLATLPKPLEIVLHEDIHNQQNPEFGLTRWLINRLRQGPRGEQLLPGFEWMEVVAHRLTNFETHEVSTNQLINQLMSQSGEGQAYEQFDQIKVAESIRLVDQLLALGETPKKIVERAMKLGGWSNEEMTYPAIRRQVEELKKKQNLTDEALLWKICEYREKLSKDWCKAQRIALKTIDLL